jgi:hypothetical protein
MEGVNITKIHSKHVCKHHNNPPVQLIYVNKNVKNGVPLKWKRLIQLATQSYKSLLIKSLLLLYNPSTLHVLTLYISLHRILKMCSLKNHKLK